jgi:chromosome segregation ATPase
MLATRVTINGDDMAKNDNPVTLEMTWAAAQAAARKHNCTIQALTNKQVEELMPYGSSGCIAAFLRQVRIQDLAAQAFDLNVFSPPFKSAIVTEMRRFVENAVEVVRQETRVTEEVFDQCCKDLDEAQETISTLRSELAANALKTGEETRRLELEIAGARERLAALQEAKSALTAARDESARAHESARNEIMNLRVGLAEVTHQNEADRVAVTLLQQRLTEAERDREAAAQKAALAEQRAAHAESLAAEQKERIKELRDELSEAKVDRRSLEAKLTTLQEQQASQGNPGGNHRAKSAATATGKSGKVASQPGNGGSLS